MLMALGHADGLRPAFALLEAGLLCPYLGGGGARGAGFEQWLAPPGGAGLEVFAPPLAAARAVGEDLGLPELSNVGAAGSRSDALPGGAAGGPPDSIQGEAPGLAPLRGQEADGLEWLLRLAVLWQQVAAAPLRRTQQGGLFKRDLERLGQDPLLNGPAPDQPGPSPVRDQGLLAAALGELEGVVGEADGELRAGSLPAATPPGVPR